MLRRALDGLPCYCQAISERFLVGTEQNWLFVGWPLIFHATIVSNLIGDF
jgi:hypothetical protein